MSVIGRRSFLKGAVATGAAIATGGAFPPDAARSSVNGSSRKLVLVLFGGGTRSSESIDDPEHRYIPRLWNEMVPKGTLFTNVRVEGKVVHPNSAGSIVTGHWEWDDIDWSKPVAHPTIFEIFRKQRCAPDTSVWAFVYASILAKAGESSARGFGREYGANVVEPPTIPRSAAQQMDGLMRAASDSGSKEESREASVSCARLARSTSVISRTGLRSDAARGFVDREYESWRSGSGSTSHDLFLTERVVSCMRQFAPDVLAVMYGEIDCAHYGSWSRYVEAIRRTDDLTWRLWRETQTLDAYLGKTLFLILPDHGRELESEGGWGFIHHSDFYTNKGADEGCRRVWMVALGPDVSEDKRISTPVPITAAAATALEYFGLKASPGASPSILGVC